MAVKSTVVAWTWFIPCGPWRQVKWIRTFRGPHKALNPETVSATDLSRSHYLLLLRLQTCFEIDLLTFYQALQRLVSFAFTYGAVIKFRGRRSRNNAPNLVPGAPKPHTVPGPQFYTITTTLCLKKRAKFETI